MQTILHLNGIVLKVVQFVALFSSSVTSEPFYIVKVFMKDVADADLKDKNDHVVLKGEKYFAGKYLQRMKETRRGYDYKLVGGIIYFRAEEILCTYVDVECTGEYFFLNKAEYNSVLRQFGK